MERQDKQLNRQFYDAHAQAEYAKQMALGAAYDKEKKYADAFQAYHEALKHAPGDAKAGAAIKLAAELVGKGTA